MCFSATMTGVEKNTMESRSAFSTSAAAIASTASDPPIIVSRRCLRVMLVHLAAKQISSSSVYPERLESFIELAQTRFIWSQGTARVVARGTGLLGLVEHHVGPDQA